METTEDMNRMNIQRHGKPTRYYDIDWLRVLGMVTIFCFHCARFFNFEDWHIKNNQLSSGMTLFIQILVMWMMPLFFVLSGIASFYALRRGSGAYLGGRVKRLLLPFLFGTFVLIPPQVWIERVSHGDFSGSLLEFWPHYFDGWYAFGGNFAWMGLHLWYLEMLFLWSLLTLPIFLLLRKLTISGFMSRFAGLFKKPAAIFLLAVPLVLMELLVNLQRDGVGRRDFGGWSSFTYLIFFILGYLLATDAAFLDAAERYKIPALIAIIVLFFVEFLGGDSLADSPIAYQIESIFRGLHSWCWLVAILGFARRYLTVKNAFLHYANEAVLPFYILHQTVIVIIAFFMVEWQVGIAIKYLMLWIMSFAVIMGLYEGIVKRLSVTRFLFGLKPLKKSYRCSDN